MRPLVVHAPRQTCKTSILLALQDWLNAEGKYRCLYVNFEGGQAAGEDTARALQALLGRLASRCRKSRYSGSRMGGSHWAAGEMVGNRNYAGMGERRPR